MLLAQSGIMRGKGRPLGVFRDSTRESSLASEQVTSYPIIILIREKVSISALPVVCVMSQVLVEYLDVANEAADVGSMTRYVDDIAGDIGKK